MKHLLNFDTVAEYDAIKDTLEKPYIVTIDENNGLQYNTDVIRVPEGSCGGGGGDTPSGGGQKVRYFNIKPLIDMDLTQASQLLKKFPGLLAVKAEGTFDSIAPFAAFGSAYYDEITSAAILDNFRGYIENSNDLNSSDIIPQMLQFGCTEITEEEFYNLNA